MIVPYAHRAAITLLETILGAAIFAMLLGALLGLLSRGSSLGSREMEIFGLQADAQRALIRFINELQEGMELVAPQPGNTLPYAVIRDKLNRLAVYSLCRTEVPGEYALKVDVGSPQGLRSETLFRGVSRLTFSSLSDGAVRLHLILGAGDRQHAFYTQIRMRNRSAASL